MSRLFSKKRASQLFRNCRNFSFVPALAFFWAGSLVGADPSAPPTTQVQIINATSVPSISLSVNGKNSYPDFPQGLYTADAPIATLNARYRALDPKSGASVESAEFKYDANARQSLVILGDFSLSAAPGTLAQPGPKAPPPDKPFPPSVIFRLYSHSSEPGDSPVRLRVLNGMPGKTLKFSSREETREILPGFDYEFKKQPPLYEYTAEVDGKPIPVFMRQEDVVRNAMVIFYLQNGEPAFMRAFENK